MAKKPKPGKAASGATLEARLAHTFAQPDLLRTALTHRSYSAEHNLPADNERLEFLGDALVGLLAADSLFSRFPQSPEGVLTRLRAMLVSRKQLGDVGASLNLGAHLLLGKGEEISGGRSKHVLLANAVESVTAAIYLDGGLEAARAFVEREIIAPKLSDLEAAVAQGGAFGSAGGDYKTALQELLQSEQYATSHARPEYVVLEDRGHGTDPRFRIELRITLGAQQVKAQGEGRSKKEAQQQAAHAAFASLTARAKDAQ